MFGLKAEAELLSTFVLPAWEAARPWDERTLPVMFVGLYMGRKLGSWLDSGTICGATCG